MKRLSKVYILAACFVALAVPVLAAVMIDATFAHLYPEPWWKTGWGKMLIGVGVALATAGALAFTVAKAGTLRFPR